MRTNDKVMTRERERRKDTKMPKKANKANKANCNETRLTDCLP